jgi:hypothetical protein
MARYIALILLTGIATAGMSADSRQVAGIENIYADLNDAYTIIETIDSGLFTTYRGKDMSIHLGNWRHCLLRGENRPSS